MTNQIRIQKTATVNLVKGLGQLHSVVVAAVNTVQVIHTKHVMAHITCVISVQLHVEETTGSVNCVTRTMCIQRVLVTGNGYVSGLTNIVHH